MLQAHRGRSRVINWLTKDWEIRKPSCYVLAITISLFFCCILLMPQRFSEKEQESVGEGVNNQSDIHDYPLSDDDDDDNVSDSPMTRLLRDTLGDAGLLIHFVHIYPTVVHRLLCAVEAATRSLRGHRVTIKIHASNASDISRHITAYPRESPIRVEQIKPEKEFANTPLLHWFRAHRSRSSKHRAQHLADAIRLAILYKHGGLYVDMDMVITSARILRVLNAPPMLTTVSGPPPALTNSLMYFAPGDRLLQHLMLTFRKTYDRKHYAANGPMMLRRVYATCVDHDASSGEKTACENLTVISDALPSELSTWKQAQKALNPRIGQRLWRHVRSNDTYIVHYFHRRIVHSITHSEDYCHPPGSLLDYLFRNCCPRTVTSHPELTCSKVTDNLTQTSAKSRDVVLHDYHKITHTTRTQTA